MDLKKRRSSLRKYIPKDDENGASAVTPRLKRRISFSGKRLVREFHVEKEPKTWDNSYEVSDHINVEEMDGKVPEFENAANPNIQNPQKSTFSRPEELFGENCDESTQNVNDNTLKYLINKPLSNNTLCIENSVDITLFENERQYFTKPKKNVSHCNLSNSNQSNINSFSLYENEFFELPNLRCKVYGERTIDFMDDLKDLRVGKEANSTEKKIDLPQEEDILEPRSDVNQPEMTTNCSLSDSNLDSKKEIFPVKVGLNNSCKTVDEMDITIQKDMNEQSSNIFWDTKKGNMFPVKVTLPDCCTTLGEMDITTQNDLNFDKENINPANTTDVDTAKSREHLNARKLYQLKPTTSDTSYMDIDNQLTTKTNTRIAKSSEDFSRMIDSMSLLQESNENCADSQRDIDEDGLTSCPNKEIHVSQRNKGSGSTDMDEDISSIKTPITRHMTSTKKLLDNCGPPKLVVRKICTPLMSHSKNIVGLEARLLERYHNKQGKEPTPDKCTDHVSTTIDAAVKPKGLDNSLNFSISNTKNMSLSSESSSSLLIPSEYKTYNLKQLNDDIEGGKIQLFSKTPTTDGKTKYSNLENRKFNKNRKTLFFDDNIDMDATTSEEKIDIFESNACRFTVNQNISANPRISLYEDKFLDNTSFLTNAKLDDTASRNNTKRELYNMHDIDMFEETQREAAKQLEKTSYDQNNAEIESFFPYHKLAEIHDNVNITEFCTEDTNQNHEPLHTIVCNNDILDNRETEKIYNDVESDAKKIVQIRVDEENFQPQKAQYDSKSITKPSNERKTIFGSFDMDIEYTDSAVFQKITENEISCYYGVGQKTHNAIYISQLDPSDKLRPKIDMENQKLSRQTIYCVNDMELENYEGDTNLETKRSYGGVQNDNLFLEPDDMVLEKSINRSHVIEEPGTKKTLEREFETSTTTCLNDDTKGPLEICEQNTCSNLIDKATSSENYSRNQKKTRRTRILNESIDFEPSENGRLVANKTLAERYTKNITDTRILDESINVIFHEKDANENANSRTKGDNMVHNDIMNEMSANNELDVSDNVEKSLDKKSICCRPAHLKIIPKNDYVNESIMEYHGMDLDNSINILVGNIGPNDGEPKENTYTHNICNLDKDFSELRREEEGPHNATNISEKELHPKKIYTCNEECEDNGELLINEVEDITSPEAVIKESACGKRVLVKCYVTPKVLPLKLRKIPPEPQSDDVVPMTPQHHSITEFLAYEQTANSSIHNECTHKRLPIHLTPLSSNAKKRQTVLFTEGENDSEQRNYNAKFNESINDSHKDLNIHHIKESSPPLYGDDSVEMLTSDIMKSGDMKDDVENTSESIQEIRKAAFNRRTKSNMKFLEPIHSGETYKCTESFIFDGKSISIHDISECFSSNKKSVGESLDVHKEICLETMKGINFQNCYINLTCDNTLANIDQTTFSLVKTISDDDDDDNEFEEKTIERSKDYKSNSFTKVNVTNTCRKCKNCQQSIQSESVDIVDDTFHLPKMQPIPTLDLNRLKRLRCRPHILDVNSLWQRVSLDRTVVNTNDLSTSDSQIECSIIIEPIKRYVMSNKIKKKHLNVPYVDAVVERKSAASRICELSRQKFSRWIIDRQLEEKCILMFAHRKLETLAIMFTYEELDPFGMEIQLKTVEVTKNMVPRETWKPIDFVLEFHLKLCLPFNLLTFCGKGNENGIMEIMQKIDTICNQIINLGVRLQQIVYTHGASIIRDQHRTYVYKVVRRIVSRSHQYPLVEKIEFKIELLNLKKLSYKDITMPSLHKFSESIHSLPNGVEFLNIFLNNPLMYLNMNE